MDTAENRSHQRVHQSEELIDFEPGADDYKAHRGATEASNVGSDDATVDASATWDPPRDLSNNAAISGLLGIANLLKEVIEEQKKELARYESLKRSI